MFLSQPGIDTLASYHWALITVSIESAIRSRDWSEKLMPCVPIEIASDTPTVKKRSPTRPAAFTPSRTASASAPRWTLHGLPSYHIAAIPTCGLCRSSSVSPTAWSIAWEAPCAFSSVTRALILLSLLAMVPSFAREAAYHRGLGAAGRGGHHAERALAHGLPRGRRAVRGGL